MLFNIIKYNLVLFYSNKKTLYTKLETALTRILKKNFMHLHPLSSMSIRVNTAFRRKTKIIRNMQSTTNKRKVEVLFLLVAHMILKFSKKKNVMSTMELKRIFVKHTMKKNIRTIYIRSNLLMVLKHMESC